MSAEPVTRSIRALGGFFGMTVDVLVCIFTTPLAWKEYLAQSWFVARVSLLPAVLMMIPYSIINTFIFNILLREFGAADFSGAGAAFFNVNQIGPLVTVLVTAGAGATAMCADLGARTIRDELDAQRVMGINPIQSLVVPRVLAATTVSVALIGVVILVGMIASFFFCVFVLHVCGGLRFGNDSGYRTWRCPRLGGQGIPLRTRVGFDRLLQGDFSRRRSGRCRQCRERDSGDVVHGPVHHKHHCDRYRCPIHREMKRANR